MDAGLLVAVLLLDFAKLALHAFLKSYYRFSEGTPSAIELQETPNCFK